MDSWKNWRVAIDVSASAEIADALADGLMECGTELGVSVGPKGSLRSIDIVAEANAVTEDELHKIVETAVGSVADKLTGYDALFATYWTEYGYSADPEETVDTEDGE